MRFQMSTSTNDTLPRDNSQPLTDSNIDVRAFNEGDDRSYGWLIFWGNAINRQKPIRIINYRRSLTHPWRARIDIEGEPTLSPDDARYFMLAMRFACTLLKDLTEQNEIGGAR